METQGHDMGQAVGRGPGGTAPAPATVLVVDSDARALRLLEVGLRQAGYRVNAALSGDDAVAQAEVETPSVAIIDAELHDVDGFGLSARLRAMPGCERLLLLFSGVIRFCAWAFQNVQFECRKGNLIETQRF